MKFYLRLILLLIGVGAALQVHAQSVSGRVTDDMSGEPLPGVSIRVKGTTRGGITNLDGAYSVQAGGTDTLIFSYIGYLQETVPVANRSTINISMAPDVETLSELVVIGYGATTKKELTGAVSIVNEEAIKGLNPVRLEQALQGQVAGVNISTASGSPGGAANIRIRGITTNGNNDPLILVDGIPYSTEGLNALNPADIESVNVLKDATAGIYGVRAANGVVLITTKKGLKNAKPVFSFDGYTGTQSTARRLNLLNAQEFAVLKNEAFAAGGQNLPYPNANLGQGTDWQDQVFQDAPIRNYNFGMSGGTDKSTYSIGSSYLDQEGIIGGDKSSFSRYNARINFTTELAPRLNLENVFLISSEKRKTLPENGIGSVLYNTINASPLDPVRQENGDYTYLLTFNDLINPVAQMANTFNEGRANKLVGKQEFSYDFDDRFKLTARASYSYATVAGKVFNPLVHYGPGKAQNSTSSPSLIPDSLTLFSYTTPDGQAIRYTIPRHNNVSETEQRFFDYNLEAFLNYNQTFNTNHALRTTLGVSFLEVKGESMTGTAFNVPYNSWDYADISAAEGANLLNTSSSWQSQSRLQSVFGRAEYSFKEKYILSALLRRDGSSNFGKNNRFGYFPAASAAWVISDEAFFTPQFINFMKLRASYGVLGNDKIGQFRYRALLNGEGVYVFNDNLVTGRAVGTLGNPDLRWEQNSQFNIGVDLTLLKGKLDVSTDYFIKATKDLLFQPDVSGVLGGYGAGGAPPFVNGGDIRNRGFEFLISYREELGRNGGFNISYNLTTIKNEVTALPAGVDFYDFASFGVGGMSATRMEVGQPIGYFFGYQTDGVYQSQEEIAARGVTQPGAQPGDLRYVDQDGDGVINFSNNSDKTFLGSAIPKVTMGLNLGVNYAGIDLSANIFSSMGNKILRNYERQQPLANLQNYRLGRWTGEGSTNEHPRLTTAENRNAVMSDYYVEDGSFIRIRNLQLGYSLPQSLINEIGVERLRVYVSANNLFTFTGYKGFDPEFSSGDPTQAGIDYGFYPQARTLMVGVNLNF
ncbi:SusC/RagA family TonB-linked outer membrane protein [Cesiribacter andamanensis]|uniref:Outer membrane receptor FepA n=1 Tax=Cesiribacter andamanensis AMV16 TaxID=1279009 RepID=M7NT21_9BACT|nr:TonB-dependent receptor [Cesiribacter andamanensis]EMR01634.1 outer membrane receptor FepA [Cesiribacter andamanensis AMV16]